MEKEKLFKIINPERDYSENDLRFKEMLYMIQKSNIPQNVIGKKLVPDNVDLIAFETLADIQQNIFDFVKNGKNLYLYSSRCGNGKTTWSIKLMLQYFNEVWPCNCFTERGLFINVPIFLTKLKSVISKPDDDFETMKSLISIVDLVVWDDIAATKLSDFDYNNLLTYIDSRTVDNKSNIYTGNIDTDKLPMYVGKRLSSRILGNSNIVEFKGSDKR